MTPPLPSQAGAPSCRAVLLCSSQVPPHALSIHTHTLARAAGPKARGAAVGMGVPWCWVGSFCEVPLHGLCSDEQRGGYSYSRNCLW